MSYRVRCDNFLNTRAFSARQADTPPAPKLACPSLSPRALLLAELLASGAEMREVVRAQLSILPEEFGLWLSLVERLPRVQEAVGSNPTSPMAKM